MISYDIVMTGFAGWNGSRSIYMDERYKIYGRMELYYIFEIYGKLWI